MLQDLAKLRFLVKQALIRMKVACFSLPSLNTDQFVLSAQMMWVCSWANWLFLLLFLVCFFLIVETIKAEVFIKFLRWITSYCTLILQILHMNGDNKINRTRVKCLGHSSGYTETDIPREGELQKGIKMEFSERAFKAFGKCLFLASLSSQLSSQNVLHVCLEDKDFIIYLAHTSERAGPWPCARQEAADPSLSTGEQEKRLPLGAGCKLEKGQRGIPPWKWETLYSPSVRHNSLWKKTKQSHAKVQQRKSWKIG